MSRTIVIDPDFSVYKLVNRIRETSTMISHRRTMTIMSYQIEDATRLHKAHGRIFAAFQLMSKFVPQMARYRELAQHAEQVYVFGVPDVVLPPIDNITYVMLQPQHQLSREWFVVNHGRDFQSVLATEELSDVYDPDDTRIFSGLWTFDVDMVSIIEEWLSSAVDARPLNLPTDAYNFQRQSQIMSSIMERLLMQDYVDRSPQQPIVEAQIKTVVKETVEPQLSALTGRPARSTVEGDAVILFSDIRDFTSLAEQMEPSQLVEHFLNPYIQIVTEAVTAHGGMIDKFLGDGILAIFRLDQAQGERMVDNALAAAVGALSTLEARYPDIPVGFGLAQGRVLIGEIGSTHVRETTVIGDAVNTAQRLSSLGYNGIWASDSIYDHLSTTSGLEVDGEYVLKGKALPHTVYRYNAALAG